MCPATNCEKRHKKNAVSTLSDSEFYFIYGGMSYTGGCVDKVKISNLVMEYAKKNKM